MRFTGTAAQQNKQNWDLHLPEFTGFICFEPAFGREVVIMASPSDSNQYALDLRLHMEKAY